MSLYLGAGADPGIPSSFTDSSHHLLNRHLQNKFQQLQSMKVFFLSQKNSGLPCMPPGYSHLYLLRVHDVDRQVECPQHHIAVAIAVMWCTLRGGGGMAAAVSTICPPCGNTCTTKPGYGGLRWGTLHQVNYLPIYIWEKNKRDGNHSSL